SGVELDGQPVRASAEELVVYAVNKPAGVVSTANDPQGRPPVVSLVKAPQRLYPVGRLDADTTGLILLTNDGDLANHLMHPRYEVPRTYRAKVGGGAVGDAAVRALRAGVELDDGRTAPARVRRLRPDVLEITLREGRKRQVRAMGEAVGHPVLALRRTAFGPLDLGDLAAGAHRRLSRAEVDALRAASRGPRGPGARGRGRGGASPRASRRPAAAGRRRVRGGRTGRGGPR